MRAIPTEVVKSALGYRQCRPDENHTHVIYTVAEAKKTDAATQQLERDMAILKAESSKAVSNARQSAERYVQAEHEKINAKMEVAEKDRDEKLAEAADRISQLENINRNLIRVAKERANAKRGIHPKKLHCEYILQSCDEAVFFHKEKRGKRTIVTEFPCWRSRFQTPYESQMDIDSVRDLVDDDFRENGLGIALGTTFFKKGMDLNQYGVAAIQKIWAENEGEFCF